MAGGQCPMFRFAKLRSLLRKHAASIFGQVSIAAIAADCKSATHAVNTVGSIPTLPIGQCPMQIC